MAETLSDFLIRRRREIDDEANGLSRQLDTLEAERSQLRAAASAVGRADIFDYDPKQAARQSAVEGAARRAGKPVASERTIKEAVLDILTAAGHGMMAIDILVAINTRFGFDYPRTSLSPQLSRLKSDGKLDRDGLKWSLAIKSAETNEAVDEKSTAPSPQPAVPLAAGPHQTGSGVEPERQVVREKITTDFSKFGSGA